MEKNIISAPLTDNNIPFKLGQSFFFCYLSLFLPPSLAVHLTLFPSLPPLLISIEQMFVNPSLGLWWRFSEIKGNRLGFWD